MNDYEVTLTFYVAAKNEEDMEMSLDRLLDEIESRFNTGIGIRWELTTEDA